MPHPENNPLLQRSLSRGKRGEQIATRYLQQQGYEIVRSNWRAGKQGEIDIIASHPREKLFIFVEVKTRKGVEYGTSLDAVTPQKQAQLVTLAEAYLHQYPIPDDFDVRFDVVGIQVTDERRPVEIIHLENAFTGS